MNFGKEGGGEDLVEVGLHRCGHCIRGRLSARWFLCGSSTDMVIRRTILTGLTSLVLNYDKAS